MTKNSQVFQLQIDLNKALHATYKSLSVRYKKAGLKKAVSDLKQNQAVLDYYLVLRQRIMAGLNELTLEQHQFNFNQAIQLISQSKQLQTAFLDFQTQLNHVDAQLINAEFVAFRNQVSLSIEALPLETQTNNVYRLSSNVFNVLLSFLFKPFDQTQPKLDELFLDFINEVDATVVVLSTVSLRQDKTAKSKALALVNKMSLIKMKNEKKKDPSWLKVVVMLKDQEIIGYLPKAYIRLNQI